MWDELASKSTEHDKTESALTNLVVHPLSPTTFARCAALPGLHAPPSGLHALLHPRTCTAPLGLHAPASSRPLYHPGQPARPVARSTCPIARGLHTFAHCTPPTVVVLMHWLFFASSGPNLLVLCSNQCLFWILTRSIEEETRINTSHCSRYFKYSTFCGEFCNTPGYKSHNYLP
jgi:hypothetical protein